MFAIVLLVLLLAAIYVGFILHTKRIALKDVRINSLDDAKRLLLPTLKDQTLKHLRKAA